jgi:hypothetical protein
MAMVLAGIFVYLGRGHYTTCSVTLIAVASLILLVVIYGVPRYLVKMLPQKAIDLVTLVIGIVIVLIVSKVARSTR